MFTGSSGLMTRGANVSLGQAASMNVAVVSNIALWLCSSQESALEFGVLCNHSDVQLLSRSAYQRFLCVPASKGSTG